MNTAESTTEQFVPVTARDVYAASNPVLTKALYARLETCGPAGAVALNLFRAHRCIAQALHCDAGREIMRSAYERKDWAINLLIRTLFRHSQELCIAWGWCCDSRNKAAPWTLRVDLPNGQVAFPNPRRLTGYDYYGRRDAQDKSEERIFAYCDEVLSSQDCNRRLF